MIKIKARMFIILLALTQLSTIAYSSDLTFVSQKTISPFFLTGLLAQTTMNAGYWSDIIIRMMDPPLDQQDASTTFKFKKTTAAKGSHDNHEQPDEDGIPSDRKKDDSGPPGKDDDPQALMTHQLSLLEDLLNQIGEEIERRKIKLILVFDLDGTLYLPPALMPKDLRDKLEHCQLFHLHQGWMDKLTSFLRRFQANTLLVYNTGRTLICNDDQFEQSQLSNPRTDSYLGSYQIPLQPGSGHNYLSSMGSMYIPRPDILICGCGRTFRFNEFFGASLDAQKLTVLQKVLDEQYTMATDEVERLFRTDFKYQNSTLTISATMNRHLVQVESGDRYLSEFLREFYQLRQSLHNRQPHVTVISPRANLFTSHVVKEYVMFGRSEYYSSTVNKGSILSLALELIEPRLLTDGTKKENIWEIVFGDDTIDMPMMRPDLEAMALSSFPKQYMSTRKSLYKKHGLKQDFTRPPFWTLSVIAPPLANDSYLQTLGPHVSETITHPKVVKAAQRGLPALMQPVLTRLKQN